MSQADEHIPNVRLRPVTRDDWQFLYDLLAERPAHANISHKTMPSFGEHMAFIRSEPYQAWYIIEADLKPAGSIYLTFPDEIGIHVSKAQQRSGIATKALELLMQKHPKPRYLANIAPTNWESLDFFAKRGFKCIQTTYELRR